MITQADLLTRFGAVELAQLTATTFGDPLDPVVVDAAIAEVEGLVAAALSVRYAWPLNPVPPLIAGAACDLVRALLYRDALPDGIKKRADDARRLLEQLASGKLNLGLSAPAPATTATGVDFSAPASVMGASPYG